MTTLKNPIKKCSRPQFWSAVTISLTGVALNVFCIGCTSPDNPEQQAQIAAEREEAALRVQARQRAEREEELRRENARQEAIKEIQENVGIQWIRIPGGKFLMGSDEGEKYEYNGPAHWVSLVDFDMSKTEITNDQFRKCVEAGVCRRPGSAADPCASYDSGPGNAPVSCVPWVQAFIFAKWVGARLPSEAEWEYAARGAGQDRKYPWGNQEATCKYAVIEDSSGACCGTSHIWPVCSKPNGNTPHGLCDMSGNVSEWVQDIWHNSYNQAPSGGEPVGGWGVGMADRVYRGGGCGDGPSQARNVYRYASGQDARHGFRVARFAQ